MIGQAPDIDERLLIEAAQADSSRFGELYERNFDRVYAFVSSRVGDRATAEEITAQVFHRALENLPRFEWRGTPFAAWLYRIAANAISSHAQQTSRARAIDETDFAVPPEDLDQAEQRARLFRFVTELPEPQRRVILLRFAHERSIRETAQAIGRSEGAVKQLQMRALRQLRTWLEEPNG